MDELILKGIIWSIVLLLFVCLLTYFVVMIAGNLTKNKESMIAKCGKMYLALTIKLMEKCTSICTCWMRFSSLRRLNNYVLNEKNPVIHIFCFLLISANVFVYYINYPSLLEVKSFIGVTFRLYIPAVLISCIYLLFLIMKLSNPGKITKRNYNAVQKLYNYDNVFYHRGVVCETCGHERPARSKHCKYLNVCVARYDHYCPWFNNAVGIKNYKYFHLFFFTLIATMSYGITIYYLMFYQMCKEYDLFSQNFVLSNGDVMTGSLGIVIQYFFNNYLPEVLHMLTMLVLLILVMLFEGYHLYMTTVNITSVEYEKWELMKMQIKEMEKKIRENIKEEDSDEENEDENEAVSQKLSEKSLKAVENMIRNGMEVRWYYDKKVAYKNFAEVIFHPSI